MAILSAYPKSPGPQGKTIAVILGGCSAVALVAMGGIKRDVDGTEGNVAVHKQQSPPNYLSKSRDALAVVHRPAKNADVKGSQPSASKWV